LVTVILKGKSLRAAKRTTRIATASGTASSVPTPNELTTEVGQVEGCGAIASAIGGTNNSKQSGITGAAYGGTISNDPACRGT
jgi:hypothetical protein